MSLRSGTRPAALLLVLAGAACSAPGPTATGLNTMELTSDTFADGEAIPAKHTCDGEDISPPLAWSDVPDGTGAFVLIVDDLDAGGFVHWVLTDIPADAQALPEGQGDEIGQPGANDFGRSGWGGPCPPSGEHRYAFTLYALPAPLGDVSNADAVRGRAQAEALARATLTGTYTRD